MENQPGRFSTSADADASLKSLGASLRGDPVGFVVVLAGATPQWRCGSGVAMFYGWMESNKFIPDKELQSIYIGNNIVTRGDVYRDACGGLIRDISGDGSVRTPAGSDVGREVFIYFQSLKGCRISTDTDEDPPYSRSKTDTRR
ncbi:hypothetical protein [Haloprofundus halophilus]|uniref:hypothetical protein n=1 Tax=Haloprofundus halophilus TaxID=2283527 RepID=UPI001300921C|nr:hypothetical protein [Haloprofundus halophilus]